MTTNYPLGIQGQPQPVLNMPEGKYPLRRFLGRGAYGEVWQSEAPGGVEVAVKVIPRSLKKDDSQRELDALQLIKCLHHPFLLSVQAYFSLDDFLVIVMELADGSLRARLEAGLQAGQSGLAAGEILPYFHEAAEALDYLHGHQIQHRDIKPDNLLLLGRHIKVADYGLARMLEKDSLKTATTIGTPAYMPPEVWEGKVSQQTDQYSLAASYVELRTGNFPFPCDTLAQMINAHMNQVPQMTGLAEGEQQVLLRALAKQPSQRFACCVEFVQALEKSLLPEHSAPSGASGDGMGHFGTLLTPPVHAGAQNRPGSAEVLQDTLSPQHASLATTTEKRQNWQARPKSSGSRIWKAILAVAAAAMAATLGAVWYYPDLYSRLESSLGPMALKIFPRPEEPGEPKDNETLPKKVDNQPTIVTPRPVEELPKKKDLNLSPPKVEVPAKIKEPPPTLIEPKKVEPKPQIKEPAPLTGEPKKTEVPPGPKETPPLVEPKRVERPLQDREPPPMVPEPARIDPEPPRLEPKLVEPQLTMREPAIREDLLPNRPNKAEQEKPPAPKTVVPGPIGLLIARLDDPSPTVRENAYRDLEKLGVYAFPALSQALASSPTPETRQKLQVLLGKLNFQPVRPKKN